ncbi:hypothetical protein OUZ56_026247 [Daphnia magna]|uniref:DUF6570 domain-containing protein n=1 Tax=Daphnia magna TaxID=35525 RepID=A0ABQ9ZL74_9CRUS|nr:hypothetical protein OUZ56_026247 [Daphnia magna]
MNKVLYHPVPVAELDLLKLNEERQLLFYAIPHPYQLCVSVYLSSSGKLYHLHPELVKDGIASLCSTCHRNIKSSKPKIPKLCIAAGIDFGHPGRLGLPHRQYVSILKLVGYNASERQKAKKGYVITYPQPDGTTKLAELQRLNSNFDGGEYPRTENFGEFLSICFIGSRLQFDSLIPTCFGDVNELCVLVDVVYLWLHALKHLNPLYRNASIIETEAMHMKMQNILVELIENASIVDTETEIQIDCLVTPEGSSDMPTDEIQDSDKNPDMPMPVSLLTRSMPVTTDQTQSVRIALRGLLETLDTSANVNVLNSSHGEPLNSENVNEEIDQHISQCFVGLRYFEKAFLKVTPILKRYYIKSGIKSISIPLPIHIEREASPFNEFEENDRLFYSSFPFLFILGCGLESSGTVSSSYVRPMMFQFTRSFSSCIRLIFVLFDQLQRHAASRVIASRIKCNSISFDTFSKWVNDPAFIDQLKEAAKYPKSTSSLKLLNKLNVHIKSCTSRIPFTSSQRAASLSNLIGMHDVNGTLNIRLSLPQKDNNKFPADVTGLSEAIQNNAAVFQEIPITPHHLRFLLAKGPLAAAEIFRLLTETVFTTLLGTPTEHSSKKTVPLPSRSSGVFGVPIASFGCVEEQARGSLHVHVVYWGSLPCQLLQNSAIYPEL